jgi:hypothetical protein
MVHLRTLVRLSGLELRNTKVTDDGLCHLVDIPELEHLDLGGCNINGPGLTQLARAKIGRLELDATQVTNGSLKFIRELREVTSLDLSRTTVSDDGLASLEDLPKLHRIILDYTTITDDGLQVLSRFPSLKYCRCRGTEVTVRGIARAKEKGLSVETEDLGP